VLTVIGVGDGGKRGALPHKFGRKSIFWANIMYPNILAVDIFLKEGRTGTLYFFTVSCFSFHVYVEYSFVFRNPF